MSEKYLDFIKISKSINFVDMFNWLNIPYSQKGIELKGETNTFKFIVNIEKNLFFSPDDSFIKGSVINFFSEFKGVGLRNAAKELKSYFIDEPDFPQREIPNLELHYTSVLESFGIPSDVAEKYEIGLVKQRSIMRGRITFKVYDENGELEGYVGWHPEKDHWLFPKSFKRQLYNVNRINSISEVIVTASLFDCMYMVSKGYPSCVSLIARSMTDLQEKILSKYDRIILLHPAPENIINRLSKSSFVKAPLIKKPLKEYSDEEIGLFVSHDSSSKSPD